MGSQRPLQAPNPNRRRLTLGSLTRFPYGSTRFFPHCLCEYHGEADAGVPVKEAGLDELLATPEEFGDDVPVDPDFHARRLPDAAWRDPGSPFSGGVEAVTQLHRLREVMVLIGFTRFEAAVRDIHGDYESDVQRADIALEPGWYPAVENRGEGVFAHLRPTAVDAWLRRPAVIDRIDGLRQQHNEWRRSRRKPPGGFPGGPYVLLHTLAHLLIQSVAMRCGYPASSIRERIYVESGHYGILLYTGSPDAEGTLGGLVQQARHFEDHLAHALETGSLCSNDPICAQHSASEGFEERWLRWWSRCSVWKMPPSSLCVDVRGPSPPGTSTASTTTACQGLRCRPAS